MVDDGAMSQATLMTMTSKVCTVFLSNSLILMVTPLLAYTTATQARKLPLDLHSIAYTTATQARKLPLDLHSRRNQWRRQDFFMGG